MARPFRVRTHDTAMQLGPRHCRSMTARAARGATGQAFARKETELMDALEQRTIAKVSRRLIPFLMLCYFVAYLDRVNVGFAALTMNQDLGISATAFGFGAGIFFFSYFLFEVPSNLMLERFG